MVPFRKILFPVDYSEPCRALIPYVQDMVEHFSAELTLVHGFSVGTFATAEINLAEPTLIEECEEIEKQRLHDFAEQTFPGRAVHLRSEESDPGTLIAEVVQEEHIDLVMMPTHGHGPMRRMLLGSITGKVLHDVQATVFTGVGSTLAGHQPSVPYRSIVCAVGDGPESESLIQATAAFAASYQARLALVHVVELPPTSWEVDITPFRNDLMESARTRLSEMTQKLHVNAPVHVVDFVMPDAIHDEAIARQADLIVVGRGHAHGTFTRMFSQLYAVVRAAPCPVMSI
jgi:nucleotide-binding universal stress UspA family protein